MAPWCGRPQGDIGAHEAQSKVGTGEEQVGVGHCGILMFGTHSKHVALFLHMRYEEMENPKVEMYSQKTCFGRSRRECACF